ncbi:MAG: carboxypeptidase [Treponematales bacterium]
MIPGRQFSGVGLPALLLLTALTGAAAETPFDDYDARLSETLAAAGIPPAMAAKIQSSASFLPALTEALQNDDPFLRMLVDKTHSLPADYEPDDLVELRYQSYHAGNDSVMLLRAKAEEALEEMAAAAKREGIHLVVSSAYRSYHYQAGSFERWTKRIGQAQAERISARPGKSQHQLGLTVDFGSLTNDFADTKAGRWVAANAARFGWSLSYPQDYERITGYYWESWHFRFVGKELAAFIGEYFGGIQHYALTFIHEWESLSSSPAAQTEAGA